MNPTKQIQEALKSSKRTNKTKENEKLANDWLKTKAKIASKENKQRREKRRDKLLGDEARAVSEPKSGMMYLFSYDAKYKKTLPYWDFHPIIFPLEIKGNTMLGLNMHYLPPMLRAILMDAILDLPRYKTDKQRAQMSYEIVKSFSASDLVKPTIHKYLSNHIVSQVIEIPRDEWYWVGFLPLADFRTEQENGSSSLSRVYADSRKKASS